jgi:hypothetical protein
VVGVDRFEADRIVRGLSRDDGVLTTDELAGQFRHQLHAVVDRAIVAADALRLLDRLEEAEERERGPVGLGELVLDVLLLRADEDA